MIRDLIKKEELELDLGTLPSIDAMTKGQASKVLGSFFRKRGRA